MKSLAVTSPGILEIVETAIPCIDEYEVLVRTEASYICNGTDSAIIAGKMPGISSDGYPLLLGHESVGIVQKIGAKVRNFTIGDRAIGGLLLNIADTYKSGWGGHSEYTVICDIRAMIQDGAAPPNFNETYKIMTTVPKDISPEQAGMLCVWREVYSGLVYDFGLKADDSVAVFGAGPVGLSFVRFMHLLGFTRIVVFDPVESKRALALGLGANKAAAPNNAEFDALERFDAVIDAVGSNGIINQALTMIKPAGKVCVFGVVKEKSVTIEKSDAPYNFQILFHQWPTRDYEYAAQEPLINWIRSGELRSEDFVTARFPFSKALEAVETLRNPGNIKTMLVFKHDH